MSVKRRINYIFEEKLDKCINKQTSINRRQCKAVKKACREQDKCVCPTNVRSETTRDYYFLFKYL